MTQPGTVTQPGMPGYNPHFLPREAPSVFDAPALIPADALLGDAAHVLSPDGLLYYLQTRLGSLDARIDEVFVKQTRNENLRKQVTELQKTLSLLNENSSKPQDQLAFPKDQNGQPIDVTGRIHDQIQAIRMIDASLADDILADLSIPGQILGGNRETYAGFEVTNAKEYLSGLNKSLETGAQLDMIQLQSLMSTRQSAIQLATNLTASYNDSQKSIVTNIR
jgi:hypothetical protein